MSNVLVIHPDDRSTDMLKAVYEGKGFDVITDGSISQDELIKAIEEHDTIITQPWQGCALPNELNPHNSSLSRTVAIRRGLEPLTSAVTGRRSNQLNYRTILCIQGCSLRAP